MQVKAERFNFNISIGGNDLNQDLGETTGPVTLNLYPSGIQNPPKRNIYATLGGDHPFTMPPWEEGAAFSLSIDPNGYTFTPVGAEYYAASDPDYVPTVFRDGVYNEMSIKAGKTSGWNIAYVGTIAK